MSSAWWLEPMSLLGSPGSRPSLGWAGASSGTTLASPLPQTFLQTPTTQCCQAVLLGQALCASQNPVFEGGVCSVTFSVWLLSLCSTLAGSGEQNSHPNYTSSEFLCWGSEQRLWAPRMTSSPSQGELLGFPEPAYFWGAHPLSHELPEGCMSSLVVLVSSHDSWLPCDGFWDGCWQSCQLGAQYCIHPPMGNLCPDRLDPG